jgi:D-cysteine desulfhydrase
VSTILCQACGSGATTGGLALANHLSGYGAKVVGYGVCDNEEYFYHFIDGLFQDLGSKVKARDVLRIHNAKGAGYAISRSVHVPLLEFAFLASHFQSI